MHYRKGKKKKKAIQLTKKKRMLAWTRVVAVEMDRSRWGQAVWFRGRGYRIFNEMNTCGKRKQGIRVA